MAGGSAGRVTETRLEAINGLNQKSIFQKKLPNTKATQNGVAAGNNCLRWGCVCVCVRERERKCVCAAYVCMFAARVCCGLHKHVNGNCLRACFILPFDYAALFLPTLFPPPTLHYFPVLSTSVSSLHSSQTAAAYFVPAGGGSF